MTAQHTPGPWQVHQPDTQTLAVHTRAGSIAEWPTNYDPRDVADARLIAAAPELLEAVKGLISNAPPPKGIRADYSYILYLEAAKTAIAKAEGRAP
jgi:hypothetical protein